MGVVLVEESGAFPADLLVALDRSRRRGLRAQLERELREAIRGGRLPAGSSVPPTRVLAGDLGVARSVVVEAYAQLTAEGYLDARQGSGTWVRATYARDARTPDARSRIGVNFRTSVPEPASFPRRDWLRHYRAAVRLMPDAMLGYPEPQGVSALRSALAAYLGRVRAVRATAEQMVVCGGFSQGLRLVCRALRARGIERIGVEDPCFSHYRRVIGEAGLEPVPVPLDEHGVDVSRLWDLRVPALVLSPAHSYPRGAVLSDDRREEVIAWARDTDALIVEDDNDAEYRYDREAISALQARAPDRVAYGGTASQMLNPALRIGWLALPGWFVKEVVRVRGFDDMATEALGQFALARLIEEGDLTRHLRRVRPMYRRRRDTAMRALVRFLPTARIAGSDAGLHLYIHLPEHCDEQELVDVAGRYGVEIEGAASHWADPDTAPPALVLGYGAVGEAAIERGIAALGAAYASLYGSGPSRRILGSHPRN